MPNYKLLIQYDGTKYNGWQRQNNTSNTIQEKLDTVISRLISEPIELSGSGRTDAGVHALAQTANFHTKSSINIKIDSLLADINHYLPDDIKVLNITLADNRFHARLNAVKKTYEYRIDNTLYGDIFSRRYLTRIEEPLDLEQMKTASQYFIGTHDFKSFCSNKRSKKSTIRTIENIHITADGGIIIIRYTANGFLYNMVRIMSGTLIDVGLHKTDPFEIPSILESIQRTNAGPTAPPQGLFLVNVQY